MKFKYYFTSKNILLFVLAMTILSYMLSIILEEDPDLYTGRPVIIIIADQKIPGHIYTIRGDGRYTIRYVNNNGDPNLQSFKRFEFEIVGYSGEVNK